MAALANTAFTQDDVYYNDDEMQTIFSQKRSNGAYGAFSLGYSQIDGKDAFVTGARGAFIINHSLAIGIGGYGFINDLGLRPLPLQQPKQRIQPCWWIWRFFY